jgi:hypothetical protein
LDQDQSGSPQWQVATIGRDAPGNDGIGSVVLAPLADDQGGFVWLLIRFSTPFPEPAGVEGDHAYVSSAEARTEATLQFGIQDSQWKVLPASDVSWLDKQIHG